MKNQNDKSKTVELIVGLKIPDTTAITALNTLNRIGFTKIKNAVREYYYKFHITDNIEKFKNKISNVDILVNANKNNFKFKIEKKQNNYNEVIVAVSNVDDNCSGLISTLNSLGFKNIKKIEKKTLWTLLIDSNEAESKKTAEKIAEKLLTNKHYQEHEVFRV